MLFILPVAAVQVGHPYIVVTLLIYGFLDVWHIPTTAPDTEAKPKEPLTPRNQWRQRLQPQESQTPAMEEPSPETFSPINKQEVLGLALFWI